LKRSRPATGNCALAFFLVFLTAPHAALCATFSGEMLYVKNNKENQRGMRLYGRAA
jgi:hypothetical protein